MKTVQEFLVAFGGNLPSVVGDVPETLNAALNQLVQNNVEILGKSRLYHTPCFPEGAGPDYVNAVVLVAAKLSADDMLVMLHDVEEVFGRARVQGAKRWSGRVLDLDLLAMGDAVRPDPAGFRAWYDLPLEAQMQRAPQVLILPHPRLSERAFVLVPLAEVAPDWRHPVLGHSAAELCAALPQAARQEVRALAKQW